MYVAPDPNQNQLDVSSTGPNFGRYDTYTQNCFESAFVYKIYIVQQ